MNSEHTQTVTTAPANPPFHLAFPVTDLDAATTFYRDLLGCTIGRQAPRWTDFNFFGHQITAHLVDGPDAGAKTNDVDGEDVPSRHFGAVLDWDVWHQLVDRLRAANSSFLIEPQIRFAGQTGEQATLFICDPSGNALEFKSFKDPAQLFAR